MGGGLMSVDSAAGGLTPEVVPAVELRATTVDDLVRWTAATGDFSPIHYDAVVATGRGFEGPVVNGPWKAALIMRMLTDWLGDRGEVKRLSCRYVKPDVVGGGLSCGAEVTGRESLEGGGTLLHCDIWVENQEEVRTVTGTARVLLSAQSRAAGEELPVEALKEALGVGEVTREFSYRVDPNDVARFRSAITGSNRASDCPLPAVGDVAPPTFFAALDPVERRDLLLEDDILRAVSFAKVGGGNAFNEVTYERPIVAGDVVTVRTNYEDVYERDGRSGRLLFRVRVNELFDQDDRLIATSRMGHVLAFDMGGAS